MAKPLNSTLDIYCLYLCTSPTGGILVSTWGPEFYSLSQLDLNTNLGDNLTALIDPSIAADHPDQIQAILAL